MPIIQYPIDSCPYNTGDVDPAVAAALLMVHNNVHTAAAGSAPAAGKQRAPKIARPASLKDHLKSHGTLSLRDGMVLAFKMYSTGSLIDVHENIIWGVRRSVVRRSAKENVFMSTANALNNVMGNNTTGNITTIGSGKALGGNAMQESEDLTMHLFRQLKIEYYTRALSYVFLWISLVILLSLKLPKSSKFFVHKQLLGAFLLNGTLVLLLHDDIRYRMMKRRSLCISMAVVHYYFSITLYTAMLVEGLHICVKLRTITEWQSKFKRHVYFLIAWALPAILTAAICAIDFSIFEQTTNCYTVPPEHHWKWKGSVLGILVLNVLCLIFILFVVAKNIFFSKKLVRGNLQKIKSTLRSVMATVPLLGFTFLLGFFYNDSVKVIGYIFVVINGTLGFLFFVFHIAMDQQVRLQFAKEVFGRKNIITRLSQVNKGARKKLRMTPTKKQERIQDNKRCTSTDVDIASILNPCYVIDHGKQSEEDSE